MAVGGQLLERWDGRNASNSLRRRILSFLGTRGWQKSQTLPFGASTRLYYCSPNVIFPLWCSFPISFFGQWNVGKRAVCPFPSRRLKVCTWCLGSLVPSLRKTRDVPDRGCSISFQIPEDVSRAPSDPRGACSTRNRLWCCCKPLRLPGCCYIYST